MNTLTLTLTVAAMLAGCGSSDFASTLNEEHNRRGSDITVLQAWISDATTAISSGGQHDDILGATYRLDPSRCSDISRGSVRSSTFVSTNCSDQLAGLARLSGSQQASPVLGSARHSYSINNESGTDRIYHQSGKCELVEFRTVIRNSALAATTFTGIGFYYSKNDINPIFIAANDLHAVGHTTLTDGSPATVHRFLAQGICFGLGGNAGSLFYRNYHFRPFAQFDTGGESYRIWDNVESDYMLGRNRATHNWVQSFDRQGEILR